MTVIIDNR